MFHNHYFRITFHLYFSQRVLEYLTMKLDRLLRSYFSILSKEIQHKRDNYLFHSIDSEFPQLAHLQLIQRMCIIQANTAILM